MATTRTTDRLATDTSWSINREIKADTVLLARGDDAGDTIRRGDTSGDDILIDTGNATERTERTPI